MASAQHLTSKRRGGKVGHSRGTTWRGGVDDGYALNEAEHVLVTEDAKVMAVEPVRAFCDQVLLRHDEVWAAAGTPDSVFPLRPDDLVRVAGATVADLAAG